MAICDWSIVSRETKAVISLVMEAMGNCLGFVFRQDNFAGLDVSQQPPADKESFLAFFKNGFRGGVRLINKGRAGAGNVAAGVLIMRPPVAKKPLFRLKRR